jgi:hypothetical protein
LALPVRVLATVSVTVSVWSPGVIKVNPPARVCVPWSLRFRQPIVVDEDNVIIVGNTRDVSRHDLTRQGRLLARSQDLAWRNRMETPPARASPLQ